MTGSVRLNLIHGHLLPDLFTIKQRSHRRSEIVTLALTSAIIVVVIESIVQMRLQHKDRTVELTAVLT